MPRFRPRISLLTALLLTTIVGLVIVVVQLWREVGPLREEVRRYRTELGFLNIDDPTRVHAIHLPNREEGWRWRVYLPPGGNYTLRCYQGMIPPGVGASNWPESNPTSATGWSSSGDSFEGEVITQARLKQDGEKWELQVNVDGGVWSDLPVGPEYAKYLSSGRGHSWTSNVNSDKQSVYPPGERVYLINMRMPVITETPGGGYSKRDADGPTPGVVLWLEQHPPIPPTTSTAP